MRQIDEFDARASDNDSDDDADDAQPLGAGITPFSAGEDAAQPEDLRKRELINEVVERSGIKKRFAKPVVEAMLAVMGEAAAMERGMNLQPFGKVRIGKIKDIDQGRVVVMRLRQNDTVMAQATYGALGGATSPTAATGGENPDDFDDE